jgi:hypothetical protein
VHKSIQAAEVLDRIRADVDDTEICILLETRELRE